MNKEQKEAWLKEAEMQMKAIRTLEKYNMAALAVAGLGAAFCYFNFRAADRNLLLIICSVVLAGSVIIRFGPNMRFQPANFQGYPGVFYV